MAGHVSLKENGYKVNKVCKQAENITIEINKIVDDIAENLINKNAKLINDVEKGIVPFGALEIEVANFIDEKKIILQDKNNREEVINKVKDYLFSYGILQELVDDKNISDIKVISENNIRIKENGKRKDANIKFPTKKSLINFINYVAIKNGGAVSELTAVQRLTDNKSHPGFIMRINICIEPVASDSSFMNIRKLPRNKPTLEDLLNADMFSLEMYTYFIKAVKSKLKILWCGKGGSGKTTHMNACLEYIPENESNLVIQESEELHSRHPDMLFEKMKVKHGENDVEYALRYLTQNALLQDLDRIIIGEIKGEEAMDLFNASYTGHIVWSSVHSDKADTALPKIVHYMKGSGTDYKREELLEMLSEIDLVIFMKGYKCVEVSEIEGFNYKTNEIKYNPVFKYIITKEENGYLNGYFKRINPSCSRVQQKFNVIDFLLEGGENT